MLKATGGARVGWVNSTWPLARLTVTSTTLTLSEVLGGSYSFTPGEVVALEPEGSIPLFYYGIRIVHANPAYPERMTFWCVGSRARLLEKIRREGFQPKAQATAIPRRDGIAFRWPFLLFVLLAWNAFFLVDFQAWHERRQMGYGPIAATGMLFLLTIALRASDRVRWLALKRGRSYSEVQSVVSLVCLISGGLFAGFSLIRLLQMGGAA